MIQAIVQVVLLGVLWKLTYLFQATFTFSSMFMYFVFMVECMLALYAVARAAQRANNAAQELRQTLATLLIQSVECKFLNTLCK